MELILNGGDGLRRGGVGEYTRKEAGVMRGGIEAHLEQNLFYNVVPMMRGST